MISKSAPEIAQDEPRSIATRCWSSSLVGYGRIVRVAAHLLQVKPLLQRLKRERLRREDFFLYTRTCCDAVVFKKREGKSASRPLVGRCTFPAPLSSLS
jgi:hypothetical protein